MRKPGGYAVFMSPCEAPVERDTFTCAHCNKVVIVQPMQRPEDLGGMCKHCMGMICPQCLDKGCTPFEEKLKQWEANEAARRSYGVKIS